MRITVFGATGGIGTRLVRRALDAGHQVTAVVRDPGRMPADLRGRADVVRADVMDPDAIEQAVKGADAVVSAMGPRDFGPTTVCQDSSRSIIAAMRATGAGRFLMVSMGAIEGMPGDDPFTRYVVKPVILGRFLRHGIADMRVAEAQVRDSGLDWTIVRPPRLTNKEGKGGYRKAVDRSVPGGFTMTRDDVAAALLDLAGDLPSIGHVVSIAG
ncbi:NAD(P)-dependent oxidoreductase [Actinomadura verrucosospora]|uniref:NAD-dependent epimerase/dehydratase n=1 Tax=Actinomadura verrucosospora TaxID=46165 RepID=A0A7D4A247_ACTVE|nr:NAD(P)H-binding protein [Actinomadura verrucosospora]QKG26606.1 NAD-dependent epimerase/dehydratase [Actinomadura verrucosospora]